MTINAMIIRM